MKRITSLLFIIGFFFFCGCGLQDVPPVAGVSLRSGSYDEFDKAVRDAKGSVVAVDFWATWCPPCREKFPHLVSLHEKYADKGLVCISVSLDETGDKKSVLNFLNKNHATLKNYLWTERKTMSREAGLVFEERYHFQRSIPLMVIFDRDGKRAWSSSDEPLPSEGVEHLVTELLKK